MERDYLHLIERLDDLLLDYLEELSTDDWHNSTIVPQWRVKDIAAHLLDGNLRTLSMLRDKYFGEQPEDPTTYQGMVTFLNNLNGDWVKAMQRLSLSILIDLLRSSGKEYTAYLRTLEPSEPAVFSVAWAGEDASTNQFHIQREYTEKWHHQQQIRMATGDPDTLMADEYFAPYLETSMMALPHHYRNMVVDRDACIRFLIFGQSEKLWHLRFQEGWSLSPHHEGEVTCEVQIPDQIAWKIFTKGIKRDQAIKESKIIGQQELGLPFFEMIAIMG